MKYMTGRGSKQVGSSGGKIAGLNEMVNSSFNSFWWERVGSEFNLV